MELLWGIILFLGVIIGAQIGIQRVLARPIEKHTDAWRARRECAEYVRDLVSAFACAGLLILIGTEHLLFAFIIGIGAAFAMHLTSPWRKKQQNKKRYMPP